MAVPTTRTEFKEYCLRKLGKPVIEINIDDDQIDDRIDEALRYYWDYHFDGTDKVYYKHQVTSQDKANKYITVPENIIGAVRVFPIADPMVRCIKRSIYTYFRIHGSLLHGYGASSSYLRNVGRTTANQIQ